MPTMSGEIFHKTQKQIRVSARLESALASARLSPISDRSARRANNYEEKVCLLGRRDFFEKDANVERLSCERVRVALCSSLVSCPTKLELQRQIETCIRDLSSRSWLQIHFLLAAVLTAMKERKKHATPTDQRAQWDHYHCGQKWKFDFKSESRSRMD